MIREYVCAEQAAQLPPAVVQDIRLTFPDAYCLRGGMVRLAMAVRAAAGSAVCVLPFCHTVEAEAMGADIRYGDRHCGPRAGKLVCTGAEEVLALPEVDFTRGRIAEVLAACRMLCEKGEPVVLEISGPLTILNCLMEPHRLFRALRKQPEDMRAVLDRIRSVLQAYICRAEAQGVRWFSFADPLGDVRIVGPNTVEQLTRDFTVPLLKYLSGHTQPDTLISLCPKTALALTGCGCAAWECHALSSPMPYPNACLEVMGRVKFTGQACIKNTKTKLPGTIRGLCLEG